MASFGNGRFARAARVVALTAASVAGWLGCNALLGNEQGSVAELGADAASPLDARPDDASLPGVDAIADAAPTEACTLPPDADVTRNPLHCGYCGHDCQGGSCLNATCQLVTLASAAGNPFGVAVDDAFVYWTDVSGTISKVDKRAGGTPTVLVSGQYNPLAIGVAGEFVYWGNTGSDAGFGAGSIWRVAVDGGAPSLVVDSAGDVQDIVLDGTAVYWSDYGLGSGTPGIGVAALPQGVRTTLAAGLSNPFGIEVDQGQVYVASYDPDGGIYAVAKDGGALSLLASAPSAADVAIDGPWLFWTAPGGVTRAALDGSSPLLLASSPQPKRIIADGAHLYWAELAEHTLRTALEIGGDDGGRVLVGGQFSIEGIAEDATSVYWASTAQGGSILKIAK